MTESSPTPTPTPRRSRTERGTDTRAAILAATEAVLLAEGIEGVSIRKVAERCGFTAPTIYHHFGDKTGLIDTVLEERFREVLAIMQAIERGPDAAVYMRETGQAFIAFALENPDHYRLLSVPRGADQAVPSAEQARDLVKGALEDLAREGTLATADIEEAFQLVWAVMHGVISLHLMAPRSEISKNLAALSFDVMEAGLFRKKSSARRQEESP